MKLRTCLYSSAILLSETFKIICLNYLYFDSIGTRNITTVGFSPRGGCMTARLAEGDPTISCDVAQTSNK
jgi:hypothetical protein